MNAWCITQREWSSGVQCCALLLAAYFVRAPVNKKKRARLRHGHVRAVCVGAFAKQTALRGYFGELIQAWPFVFNYRCCFSSSCNKKVKFVGTLVFKMLPVQSFAGNSLHRAVDAQKQPLYGRCTLTCTLTQTHMRMHTYTNANTDAHKRTQTYTHTHTHTYTCTHAHAHVHTHIYTRAHTHTHTYTRTYTNIHARTNTHTHTHTLSHTQTQIHKYTYMYTQTRVQYTHKNTYPHTPPPPRLKHIGATDVVLIPVAGREVCARAAPLELPKLTRTPPSTTSFPRLPGTHK